jgi:hypothetical protein
MAADDHSGARPAGPVVLRIKLRYDDVGAMVQRFASNVGKSGLFLPTKSIQPVGTEVKFELRLANDVPVLVGLGRVKHVRPQDPENPRAAFGMAIELMRVSREGRDVIIRMIERRRALGLPDVAIPLPEDIEAARRSEVETQPRSDTSAVVREAMAQLASAAPSEQVLSTAQPASGPVAVAKQPRSAGAAAAAAAEAPAPVAVPAERPSTPIAVPAAERPSTLIAVPAAERRSAPVAVLAERPSAPLLTSPRAHSGAIPIAPLAPEKSRPRRPRVEELIDKAAELSAPIIAALPPAELDMQVDLDQVLNRARALAGGELEVELAALCEAAAAPVEINVEAASAELARQLGGKPIAKRDRSGSSRWVPPPPVAELRAKTPVVIAEPAVQRRAVAEPSEPAPAPDFSTKARAETELAPSATIAEAVEVALDASPSIVPQESYVMRATTPTSEQRYEDALAAEVAAVTTESTTNVGAERTAMPTTGEDHEDAFVMNASTTTALEDPAAAADALDPETLPPRSLAPVLDVPTEQGAALMIDDDADLSSFERALDAARVHTGVSAQAAPAPAEPSELDDEPAELLASGEYQLADDDLPPERTQIGGSGFAPEYPSIPDQLAAQLDAQLAEAEAEAERDLAGHFDEPSRYADAAHPGEPAAEEEVSDLDVLAEADEEDAELLAAQTDRPRRFDAAPAAYEGTPYASPPAERPGTFDATPAAYDPTPYAPTPFAPTPHAPPPTDDFASRLDLDDDEPPPSDDFDRQAARDFDAGVPSHDDRYDRAVPQHEYVEPIRPSMPEPISDGGRVPRYRRASSEPSAGYTVAEDLPQPALQLPDDGIDEFDEPHNYAPGPPGPPRPSGPDPRLLRHGRPTTDAPNEDLEDALAALDVDFDELAQLEHRRPRRPTPSRPTPSSISAPRPLPGLPLERPVTGPVPIAKSPTGQVPMAKPPTGQVPIRTPIANQPPVASVPRAKSATGGAVAKTRPPPIPAAARRQPTRQVPVIKPPIQRATTDDGVLIDFDEDE